MWNCNYMNHTKTLTGENIYKYKLRPPIFASNSHLAHHIQMHTGQKPYERMLFSKASRVEIWSPIGERIYKCKLCSEFLFPSVTECARARMTHFDPPQSSALTPKGLWISCKFSLIWFVTCGIVWLMQRCTPFQLKYINACSALKWEECSALQMTAIFLYIF